MAKCDKQTFSGVAAGQFDCLRDKAVASGIAIDGDAGQASQSGVTISWNYLRADEKLEMQCLSAPFFVSCSTISNKIHELVESCVPHLRSFGGAPAQVSHFPVALAAASFAQSSGAGAMDVPTLGEAILTFFTYGGGNVKDKDSKLKITVYSDYGNGFIQKVATRDWENYGPFDGNQGGSANAIQLTVHGPIPMTAIGNQRLKIEFEPNGDDTWKFHYSLDFKFSNGVVLAREARNRELSGRTRMLDE